MGLTYAAVAENISTIFALVRKRSPREKPTVKKPIVTSRISVLLIEYSTAVHPTNRREPARGPMAETARAAPSLVYSTVFGSSVRPGFLNRRPIR